MVLVAVVGGRRDLGLGRKDGKTDWMWMDGSRSSGRGKEGQRQQQQQQ